jgi:hypothetical protein
MKQSSNADETSSCQRSQDTNLFICEMGIIANIHITLITHLGSKHGDYPELRASGLGIAGTRYLLGGPTR